MQAVDGENSQREVVADQNNRINTAHSVALIVLAATVAAAPAVTARFGVSGFVIAYAAAVLAWLVGRRAPLRFGAVVAVAIVLRLVVVFAPPRLSGDIYRYLWDGRTLASGHNPYASPPNDPRINHPEIPTIYPPHAELLFAVAHQITIWRLLLIAADIAALFLLRERALAYATFPPLIFEGAWNGHIEPLAATLLLVAWLRDSGTAAALAAGLKIIPLAALPALLIRSRRRQRFLALFVIVLLAPAIPFLLAGPFMPGMHDYATRWVFNSPLYDVAFTTLDSLNIATHLKSAWTTIKDPLHLETISQFVYAHLYSDLLARCILAAMAIALIIRFRRDPAASIGSLLLCSPAIHPWYWLVLAPFASGAWLWFALCAPFSYLLYAGVSRGVVYALCYGLPLLIALLPLSRRVTSIAGWRVMAARSHTGRGPSPR